MTTQTNLVPGTKLAAAITERTGQPAPSDNTLWCLANAGAIPTTIIGCRIYADPDLVVEALSKRVDGRTVWRQKREAAEAAATTSAN
jgi:hypothetical protein